MTILLEMGQCSQSRICGGASDEYAKLSDDDDSQVERKRRKYGDLEDVDSSGEDSDDDGESRVAVDADLEHAKSVLAAVQAEEEQWETSFAVPTPRALRSGRGGGVQNGELSARRPVEVAEVELGADGLMALSGDEDELALASARSARVASGGDESESGGDEEMEDDSEIARKVDDWDAMQRQAEELLIGLDSNGVHEDEGSLEMDEEARLLEEEQQRIEAELAAAAEAEREEQRRREEEQAKAAEEARKAEEERERQAAAAAAATQLAQAAAEAEAALAKQREEEEARAAAEAAEPDLELEIPDEDLADGLQDSSARRKRKNLLLDTSAQFGRAKAGNSGAQLELGNMYAGGLRGLRRNRAKALHWWSQAAKQGVRPAIMKAATTYETGAPPTVQSDYKRAFEFFMMAAKLGDPEGARKVACMYREGKGVDESEAEAFRWNLEAAKGGNPDAMCDVGVAYRTGKGTEVDAVQAIVWLRRANGERRAQPMRHLGEMLLEGEGFVTNEPAAFVCLKVAEFRGASDVSEALARTEAKLAENVSNRSFARFLWSLAELAEKQAAEQERRRAERAAKEAEKAAEKAARAAARALDSDSDDSDFDDISSGDDLDALEPLSDGDDDGVDAANKFTLDKLLDTEESARIGPMLKQRWNEYLMRNPLEPENREVLAEWHGIQFDESGRLVRGYA